MSTGYLPSNPVSQYQLDSLNNPFQTHRMDLSADPWASGLHSSVWGDTEKALYERRYGPFTFSNRFKRWAGPSNEVRSFVAEALQWRYDAIPTEREITDAQASNDPMYRDYIRATSPGFSPGNPVHIDTASRPHGLLETVDSFWNMAYYEFNDHVFEEPPVDPPVDPPAADPFPEFPNAQLRKLRNRVGYMTIMNKLKLEALRDVLDWSEEVQEWVVRNRK